jgi:hypothetical protein
MEAVGRPVPIEQLEVGSVYSSLSDRIDGNARHGIGFPFTVTRRLGRRAVEVRGLNSRILETVIASNYPPNTMFQRHLVYTAEEIEQADKRAQLRMEQQMLGKVAFRMKGLPDEQGRRDEGLPGSTVYQGSRKPGGPTKLISEFLGRGGTHRKTKKHRRRRGTRRH